MRGGRRGGLQRGERLVAIFKTIAMKMIDDDDDSDDNDNVDADDDEEEDDDKNANDGGDDDGRPDRLHLLKILDQQTISISSFSELYCRYKELEKGI